MNDLLLSALRELASDWRQIAPFSTDDDEEGEGDFDDRPVDGETADTIYSGMEPSGFLSDLIPDWFRKKVDTIIPGDASDPETFQSFFAALGIQNFKAHELLRMGGSNASGACAGTNSIPEKALWPNIVPTIRALDEIRDALGYGINTTSVYRAPPYNECLRVVLKNGAAKRSQHLFFKAIDFKGVSGTPDDWHRASLALKDKYGIWTKRYKTFVHIDTRFFG